MTKCQIVFISLARPVVYLLQNHLRLLLALVSIAISATQMKGHNMSSTIIMFVSILATLAGSAAIVRHLDTRQRVTGKAYDAYDMTLQVVAMFAPFVTMIAVCFILS